MAYWKKTQAGRIVYDRKPTLFKYRDIHRIAQKLEPPVWLEDISEYVYLIRTLGILHGKLAEAGFLGFQQAVEGLEAGDISKFGVGLRAVFGVFNRGIEWLTSLFLE